MVLLRQKEGADSNCYRFVSPVIGVQTNLCTDGQKLHDVSVTKQSYKPHHYQRNLAVHTDQNAVAKNLKHDCYMHTVKSNTKECYSAPPLELLSCAPEIMDPAGQQPMHTMKKMAQEYKYSSSVFVKPDKLTTEKQCTTHQCHFTPVTLDFLTDKRLGFVRKDIHATSNQGVRLADPMVKSEYNYRFVMPKEFARSKSGFKNPNGVRGRARLNVTHNTITGDRFDIKERKTGRTHTSDEFSPWTVKREDRAHDAKVRNTTTSIPQGDPDKERKKLSSNYCSYQNPSTFLNDLRFNTLAETSHKTFHSSFKYKASENIPPDAFCTTTSTDYGHKKGSIPPSAGSNWTRGNSSVMSGGNLDLSEAHKIQPTTKGTYVKPSTDAYRQHVDRADLITQSSVQLGSPEFHPTSRVTTAGTSFVPFPCQPCEHIIPTPKNQLMLTPCTDFAQSSAMQEAFQPSTGKPLKAGELARKIKNRFDFTNRVSLPSREPPHFSTTHQVFYSNPNSRMDINSLTQPQRLSC